MFPPGTKVKFRCQKIAYKLGTNSLRLKKVSIVISCEEAESLARMADTFTPRDFKERYKITECVAIKTPGSTHPYYSPEFNLIEVKE